MNNFILLPPVASEYAFDVDIIFYALVSVSVLISLGVLVTGVTFAVRYRRGSGAKRGQLPRWVSREVEIGWTVATLFAFIFFFWFAASAFLAGYNAPPNALEIHVVGKQWMWKIQHPDGAREINELHVPAGVPVRLILISQDVIHSFFLPALRIKQDAVPGRYTQLSFVADKTGDYNLFCAEYCGTDHAHMGGRLIVQSPAEYAVWSQAQPQVADLAKEGRSLFTSKGCSGCHGAPQHVKAPNLAGIYGSYVTLADGRTVRADAAYLRDSLMFPKKDVVAGYDPIMPSYGEALTEGEVFRILAYLKTLSADGARP